MSFASSFSTALAGKGTTHRGEPKVIESHYGGVFKTDSGFFECTLLPVRFA